MLDFDITLSENATKALRTAPDIVAEEMAVAVLEGTAKGESAAKELVGKKTRHLQRSIIGTAASIAGDSVSASYGTNVSYAAHHEYGTRPHIIRPRRKKALAFTVGGERMVRRSVRHPGTKGRFYMRNSRYVVASDLPEIGRKMLNRITRRIAERMRGGG